MTSTEPTDENAQKRSNLGRDLAMAGVILQLIGFGMFTFVAARFHFTSRRFTNDFKQRLQPVGGDKTVAVDHGRTYNPNWRRLLYAVNVACAMILVS